MDVVVGTKDDDNALSYNSTSHRPVSYAISVPSDSERP